MGGGPGVIETFGPDGVAASAWDGVAAFGSCLTWGVVLGVCA